MSRVSITLTTGSASPGVGGPRSARFFIAGQTGLGPVDGPVVVTTLAQYVAQFGPRTGGSAMYDAAEMFLDRANAGELVVTRATGPSTVKATASLSAGAITVTAKNPGASYNAWTAAYTSASKTLTLVKGSTTATYTGTDAATLQAAAAVDPDVTVVVSSLPGSDITATALATGADDFANVVWATTLALIPDFWGPGAIAIPGVAYGTASAGTSLAAHAKSTRRLALLSIAAGGSRATAVSAAATISAYTGAENCVLVWPEVVVAAGATGVKTIDPTSWAAALRSITHRVFGVGESPIRRDVAGKIVGANPALVISESDEVLLEAAHVATIRPLPLGIGLDNWQTASNPGNVNLYDAQFRDITNAAAAKCALLLDRGFVGHAATATELARAQAEIEGALAEFKPWLRPLLDANGSQLDPGYRVTVSNGNNPADNRISVAVGLRFAEYADYVDFTLNSADAGTQQI